MHKTFFKVKPVISVEYLKWVVSLPSVISQVAGGHAHHIKRPGYCGGVKAPDIFSMPLTLEEHTDFHKMGWQSWEEKNNVDQRDLVLQTIELAVRDGIIKLCT